MIRLNITEILKTERAFCRWKLISLNRTKYFSTLLKTTKILFSKQPFKSMIDPNSSRIHCISIWNANIWKRYSFHRAVEDGKILKIPNSTDTSLTNFYYHCIHSSYSPKEKYSRGEIPREICELRESLTRLGRNRDPKRDIPQVMLVSWAMGEGAGWNRCAYRALSCTLSSFEKDVDRERN